MAPPSQKKRATGKPSAPSAKTTTNKRTSTPHERSSDGKVAAGSSKDSRKRKATESDSESGSEAEEAEPEYSTAKIPILREIERYIPKSDFKKWPHPTEKQQEDLRGILKAAEAPALMTFRREGARKEAHRAITAVSNKLLGSLHKTHLPPMGKDFTLNCNDLIHKTGELEAILEPTLRYNAELEKELEREKARLTQDEKDLAVLQNNAKAQHSIRVEKSRKLPRALRTEPQGPKYSSADSIGLSVSSDLLDASTYKLSHDKSMRELTAQLVAHIHQMENNTNALGDIPESIQRSRGVIEEVLERGLPKLYHKVMVDL